jgi:hypothetical protein
MEQPTEVFGIFRDDNGALINKNNDALLSYKKKKEGSLRVEKLENVVNNLSKDVNEIKNMLEYITSRIKVQ